MDAQFCYNYAQSVPPELRRRMSVAARAAGVTVPTDEDGEEKGLVADIDAVAAIETAAKSRQRPEQVDDAISTDAAARVSSPCESVVRVSDRVA